jgi:hypothetical protein
LATGTDRMRPAEGMEERSDSEERDGIRMRAGVHSDADRGARIPYTLFDLVDPPAERTGGGTLIVHPKGRSALLSADGHGPGELVRKLVKAGQMVVAIDVFGIGESTAPQDPKQPRGSTKFFTTFNRTDTAERVGDIVEAIGRMASLFSGEGGGEAPAVNVVGIGAAGPWCLLACGAFNSLSQGSTPRARSCIARICTCPASCVRAGCRRRLP